jgi:hypothetical protein
LSFTGEQKTDAGLAIAAAAIVESEMMACRLVINPLPS